VKSLRAAWLRLQVLSEPYQRLNELRPRAPTAREACAAANSDFADTRRACQGIEIDEDSEVVSGAQFNWETMRLTHLWNSYPS